MKGSALMIEAAHSDAGVDDQPFPPSPLAGNVRLLKAAVYIMGILLVVGTIVLIGAIVWKAQQLPAGSAGAAGGFGDLDIAVPAGAAVRSVELDGNRMAVTLEGVQNEIVIVDLRNGKVVGRIRLTSEGPATGATTSPDSVSP